MRFSWCISINFLGRIEFLIKIDRKWVGSSNYASKGESDAKNREIATFFNQN